jgi:ribonuclease P/MRP protein subunit POP5
MKAILPTLKQKKRYVAFEVVSREAIQSYDDIKRTILDAGLSFLGELGMAEAGIRIIDDDYDPKAQRGVIKVGHKHVDRLNSALMMVRKIGRHDALIRCVGISGILAKAEKRYILA